jgi:hypothetical protein
LNSLPKYFIDFNSESNDPVFKGLRQYHMQFIPKSAFSFFNCLISRFIFK